MRVENEPKWRRVLYRALLRLPDSALLLLTAVWVAVSTLVVARVLGDPNAWWKSVLASIVVGVPALIGMHLSQTKNRLEAERRVRAPGTETSGDPSTPPGPES